MKTNTNLKLITSAVLIGMAAVSANLTFAENEATDNTVSGASEVPLGSNGSPVIPSGFISNSDQDWYRITNTAGYSTIVVTFAFQGSGPDTCRLRILGANGVSVLFDQQTETGINPHQRSYTISNPAKGAVYYIGCLGDSADGNKPYTLTIDPSPDRELINQINDLKDSIARFELMIIDSEKKRILANKRIKQQEAKLRVAKSSAEKAKIKKLIAKYKRNRASFDAKIVKNRGIVTDLKAQLLSIVRPSI